MTDVPRIRLVDVAREAGVSKTTVSAVLNETGRIPDATRAHVRAVARRMGYRPNATARLLRAGQSRLLGVAAREYVATSWVYAELTYFAQLLTATTTAAQKRGYGIVLLPTISPGDSWLDMPLDGVFVIDPVAEDHMVGDFLAASVPVVSTRRAIAADTSGLGRWVDFDTGAAVRLVLDHLAEAGARRIALLTADSTAEVYTDALAAYHAWCAARGAEPAVEAVAGPGNHGLMQAVESLVTAPRPPDALFTLVEVSPPLLLDQVQRLGIRVPADLLVVCSTEDQAAEHTSPPVTTLGWLPAATAKAAVDLLVDTIEGHPTTPGLLFAAELTPRASSARPAGQPYLPARAYHRRSPSAPPGLLGERVELPPQPVGERDVRTVAE